MRKPLTKKFLKEHVVATRKGEHHGAIYTTGFLECDTCGSSMFNLADTSQLIGVGSGSLSKWLKRENVRVDIGDKIRASFLRVEE